MGRNTLNKEEIQELFTYREGVLYNKVFRNSNALKGKISGYKGSQGYVRIGIEGKEYRRSYLVWMLHNEDIDPSLEIDHINRERDDDRIENLRLVTHLENSYNKNVRKGYTYYPKTGKYKVRIGVNNKEKYLGCYDTKEEALSVYLKAKEKYHIIKEKV